MTLEITVRGSAESHHPAERATVSMAAAIEGSDKAKVFADAIALQDPLTTQLKELVELDAVTTWSSAQVRVFSHRPWDQNGKRLDLVRVARVEAVAEFVDFERLSGFLDFWSGKEGIEIIGISWDVTIKNRRSYESEARKAAVDDAVAKAQVYANSVRRGKVVALQLSDPGMLSTQPQEYGGAMPKMMMAQADMGGGPSLDLTPDKIVIHVEVDARFSAE
ncbi:MAG: SIMPL domain-containing protein [Aeromicrobium sp.]